MDIDKMNSDSTEIKQFDSDVNVYSPVDKTIINPSNIERLSKSFYPLMQAQSIVTKPFLGNAKKLMNGLSKAFLQVNYYNVTESFKKIQESLQKAIRNLRIPTCSDEEIDEIKVSFERWGTFGWTVIPTIPWKSYFEAPEDVKTANKIARKYCGNMTSIFEEIENCRRIKRDYKEAKEAYVQKRYKSCALILFSLIDSCLIRCQDNKSNYRPTGDKAVKAIKEKVSNNEDTLFGIMMLANYCACIEVMFENAKNFKNQPTTINRNFVAHGMLWRDVRQQDCKQLFLLYYNTLQILDMIYY